MRFLTERLILRPWEESDAGSLYEYAKDPAVGPMAGWPVHTSVENSREIIRTVLSEPETYAICLREDNRAIGSIGLFAPTVLQAQTDAADLEIGFWIGVPFWGHGYVPEAVKVLQKYAFEELGCTAMWCAFYDGNKKSARCQEKCGFRFHHTEEAKQCVLMNEIRTEHFTRLTREEWSLLQKNGTGGE
ncbi:MAG: GNAT family N-acetyltransferase [Firmicutes bacterium]|nr:GNAT family N-acetyltransferase [Bacillota bacterium]